MEKSALKKSEAKIQQEIAMFYRNDFCLKHHVPRCMILSIPNESNEQKAMRLMMTGLYPGAADLLIIHGGGLTRPIPIHFFVECKAPDNKSGPRKNGQSQKQIDFEDHCKAMGIGYYLVTSCEQFKQVLKDL